MTTSPPPILSLTPVLRCSLRERIESLLIRLITKNSKTIFFRDSTLLSEFRRAHTHSKDAQSQAIGSTEHDEKLLDTFYNAIPLSSYDEYRPFVSRFFDELPCPASAVRDLLSPGFPEFIAQSSGTSGSKFKFFPRYPNTQSSSYVPDGVRYCVFANVGITRVLEVVGEGGENGWRIPVTTVTSGNMRRRMRIELGDDENIMTRTPAFSSTPFVVWYIPTYGGNLLMTLFFAIMDQSLVFIRVTFASIFYDAIRTLEQYWDVVVDAIEKGTIPEVFDLGHCKPYLEAQVKPNPDRALELRMVDRSVPGWLKDIWPLLTVIVTAASGIYSTFTPKIRHYVGPSVDIQSYNYGASECFVGRGYDPVNDHNLFRISNADHFEYLDCTKVESSQSLRQAWHLQHGKQYELVVTTQDGLWRYRMGDIIEIGGFDPADGQPLIRFIERRGVAIRIAGEFLSETIFKNAVHLVAKALGTVLEFVTEVDDRKNPRRYGFFVELDGELGSHPDDAPRMIHDFFCTDPGYKKWADFGRIGMPTVRLVARGTFQEYREWRMVVTGNPMGQMKVPISTLDPATKEWLAAKVVLEIGNL